MTRAAPAEALVFRKSRRFTTVADAMAFTSRSSEPAEASSTSCDSGRTEGSGGGSRFARPHDGGAVDGFAYALVGAAAADVAAHGVIDVGVGGVGFFL